MDVDTWRLRAQIAMHEQGTMLEIARIILISGSDLDDLTREICREVVERHRYDHFAIYLSRRDSGALILAAGARIGADLSQQDASALARESVSRSRSLTAVDDDSWRIAVPIEDGSTKLGAIFAASSGPDSDALGALDLCRSLARLVAIGILNADLQIAVSKAR